MLKDLYYQGIELEKGKGQTLTPEQIVDYMVKSSVEASLENNKGKTLSICDPACGTGRFMLGVADYCFANKINFVMWNIDIDERMVEATIEHAVYYKIPAVVILGDALLNDFKKAWQVVDGISSEVCIAPIIEVFKNLSEKAIK